jgi:hypothetical protein
MVRPSFAGTLVFGIFGDGPDISYRAFEVGRIAQTGFVG